MLVRVTRDGWTVLLNLPDDQMEAVIESANKHFGTPVQDAGSQANAYARIHGKASEIQARRNDGGRVGKGRAPVTRYKS